MDANGQGVPGVEITWTPSDPNDVIQPMVDTTDAIGVSSVSVRLGELAGAHGFHASTRDFISHDFFVHVRPSQLVRLSLQPTQLSLISRQRVSINAQPLDAAGNIVNTRLKWLSGDMQVATVDTTGLVRANRPGSTFIYVNATVPPFVVDSIPVQVRAAVPARLTIRPETSGFVVGSRLRMMAMAFDAAERPIDAIDIKWSSSNPQMPLVGREVFDDSTVISVSATAPGSTIVEARIGDLVARATIDAVADPVADSVALDHPSFCYSGITFGPSGQFYYVSNEGGSFGPEDTLAVVRTGSASATWKKSAEFPECDRVSPIARNTISIDANENLYLPTKAGVLSIAGLSGALRWHTRIGEVRGNVAISRRGFGYAARADELVALDLSDGSIKWRYAHVHESLNQGPVIDETRGVVYLSGFNALVALDMETGAVKWQLSTPGGRGDVALAADGTIYVGATGGIWAVSPAGAKVAEVVLGPILGSPVIDAQGNVYAVSINGGIYSLTSNLTVRWSTVSTIGNLGLGTPVVDGSGTVYFGNSGSAVAARDGRILWSRPDISSFLGQHWLFGSDGSLYASNLDFVYRIRTAGAGGQWPMTHGSPDRTARR